MNQKIIPHPTEVCARKYILKSLEDIYNAMGSNSSEAWGKAAGAAKDIAKNCEITQNALIIRQHRVTPLPYPTPFDMTGFAADCLGVPNVQLEGRSA